ncbi:MAG: hypothetical protein PHY73_06155 [Candidatus Omnitrophica bacterium]|nr:hypothetical protein [Candidatus Omnitrophota bacterium]
MVVLIDDRVSGKQAYEIIDNWEAINKKVDFPEPVNFLFHEGIMPQFLEEIYSFYQYLQFSFLY